MKRRERNVCRSIVDFITLVTKEVAPLLSCVNKKHDQHDNDGYNQKYVHMLKITQIVPAAL